MQRKKRDKCERRFHQGYNAGFKGKSAEACPHKSIVDRGAWFSGWRAGWKDHLTI